MVKTEQKAEHRDNHKKASSLHSPSMYISNMQTSQM